MKTIIYWITKDKEKKNQLKEELGCPYITVNGESEYKGYVEKLKRYVDDGLIQIRYKK